MGDSNLPLRSIGSTTGDHGLWIAMLLRNRHRNDHHILAWHTQRICDLRDIVQLDRLVELRDSQNSRAPGPLQPARQLRNCWGRREAYGGMNVGYVVLRAGLTVPLRATRPRAVLGPRHGLGRRPTPRPRTQDTLRHRSSHIAYAGSKIGLVQSALK
eukprot:2613570-Rhodomonas_salina.2